MSTMPHMMPDTAIYAVLDILVPMLEPFSADPDDAHRTAVRMIAEYQPFTSEELGLAAEIIAFRRRLLMLMRDASLPGTEEKACHAMTKLAIGLRRSESAAQRKLDSLQRVRRQAMRKQHEAEMAAQQAGVAESQEPPPPSAADRTGSAPPDAPATATPTAATPTAATPTAATPTAAKRANGAPAIATPANAMSPNAAPRTAASARPDEPPAVDEAMVGKPVPAHLHLLTPAEQALLPDDELAACVAAYSPGAQALAAAALNSGAAAPA